MRMRILGIETSCDETSAAVVIDGREVCSNVVSSQVDLHARYGGVVPEIAARAHIERIALIIEQALADAGIAFDDVDAIAVTDGPGLVGSLLVGVTAAKTLALAFDRPLVAVDHIAAHCTSAALVTDTPPWPAIALVVSGGHSSLYHVRDFLDIELLGQTRDDAAGEAFDKVAAILELGYPGGPMIERLARDGDPDAIEFPRTFIDAPHDDFSFSGLKTAVLYRVFGTGKKYGSLDHLSQRERADIAASFQAALVAPLVCKTVRAARVHEVGTVVVGGGVAANGRLREELGRACEREGLRLVLTPLPYCTDNAAMIAAQGYHEYCAGRLADLSLEPRGGLLRKRRGA
ncbi:MAG: tRNA (adenosine(37)-N6)-threonylcarbamoyltransferase complex transferase subunit TsaD [Planctomycetota bacterium]|nr:MAG: tRNA (adenosine(37)-N6)-threonylcarbamoyltransferase complex transferase subunit TsaD [Planctomycetota bacterium]